MLSQFKTKVGVLSTYFGVTGCSGRAARESIDSTCCLWRGWGHVKDQGCRWQLDRLGTGSQSPPASAESSEQQDCSAGAVVVGMAKQNKQYLRLKAQRVLVSQPPISASASAVPKP